MERCAARELLGGRCPLSGPARINTIADSRTSFIITKKGLNDAANRLAEYPHSQHRQTAPRSACEWGCVEAGVMRAAQLPDLCYALHSLARTEGRFANCALTQHRRVDRHDVTNRSR